MFQFSANIQSQDFPFSIQETSIITQKTGRVMAQTMHTPSSLSLPDSELTDEGNLLRIVDDIGTTTVSGHFAVPGGLATLITFGASHSSTQLEVINNTWYVIGTYGTVTFS